MKIQSMFKKDINRALNGVIKVEQDDEASLQQELGEYVITKELRKHFGTFFDNYKKSMDRPTDKIGVWISGFFGSGKSHFLKMLSYILENPKVGGKKAVEYFKDKFDEAMMYADIVRCASGSTKSILFNIDDQAQGDKNKTVILRTFAKVFYNHLGLYGRNLKIARLERDLQKLEKLQEFKAAFAKAHPKPWDECRETIGFIEAPIVSALQSVGMNKAKAQEWYDSEENPNLSIEQLVEEIKTYVDGQGKDFRLLFCIDEVGQYIGEDGDLMLNLQTIVEELGTKCFGKVWVMVTSQEAIDSVVKIRGNDFSKIQGRFDTRLSLSSSSVDEVIKRRILEKTDDAERQLRLVFEKAQAELKNIFVFKDAVKDIKGYADAADFSATFPFVPYQFIIIQKALAEIRKRGNAGKHLSGGERSMLSGFFEAAQKVQDRDENTLVPFWQFYDTVNTFLEGHIRRVIERCQTAAENSDGLEPQDVDVLKLLYLVRYIDDFKPNIDNIAILSVQNIHADMIDLRQKVAESLKRLEGQNYVARNGEMYSFLTDEEQEIAKGIKDMTVDAASIVRSIGDTVFADIYASRKCKYDNNYDFSFDSYIDEALRGTATGGIRLRLVTEASDLCDATEEKLCHLSEANREAIVVLPKDSSYFKELEEAAKIEQYVMRRNTDHSPESVIEIIGRKKSQASSLKESAKSQIEKAIVGAAFYVHGKKIQPRQGDAKAKLEEALRQLIDCVYSNLNLVSKFYNDDKEVQKILNGPYDPSRVENEPAINVIAQWLELQGTNHALEVTMRDLQNRYQGIPYGWREIEIAAMVASLVAAQRVSIKYNRADVVKDDKNLLNYLRKKSETDKVTVKLRLEPTDEQMRQAVNLLREWLGVMDIPQDKDGLFKFAQEQLQQKQAHYQKLLGEYARSGYPQKDAVEKALGLVNDVLSQRGDFVALLKRLTDKWDDILDSKENMEGLETFFAGPQKSIFDEAAKVMASIEEERHYFEADIETSNKISELADIMGMPKPYGRIKDLGDLVQGVKAAYAALLEKKSEEVGGIIKQFAADLHALAEDSGLPGGDLKAADDDFAKRAQDAANAKSLTKLDAMTTQAQHYKDSACRRIEDQRLKREMGEHTPPQKIAQVLRNDMFPVKKLASRQEIDGYLDSVRQKLYKALEENDGIQIS